MSPAAHVLVFAASAVPVLAAAAGAVWVGVRRRSAGWRGRRRLWAAAGLLVLSQMPDCPAPVDTDHVRTPAGWVAKPAWDTLDGLLPEPLDRWLGPAALAAAGACGLAGALGGRR